MKKSPQKSEKENDPCIYDTPVLPIWVREYPELAALVKVVAALDRLGPERRARVLMMVQVYFGGKRI